ncbi:MAG: SRPBCC domain-containing protein [Acidimicrobiia bacterium]|nr:MAG: SRPBCC domain-containing protein [Acidimicrobiia bacterium]
MTQIETDGDTSKGTPDHIYQIFINVGPPEVWEAIVDSDRTQKYFYGTRVESSWKEGAEVRYTYPDGSVAAEGTILGIEPLKTVDMTFQALWDSDLIAEGPARVIWRVEDFNGASKLTIVLYDTPVGSRTHEHFVNGFPYIVSGMKTLLETGESLPNPS